jgi:bifunctional non-homologous end joining protein LigD
MPRRVEVQLATLAKGAPQGDDWFHEIKLDGYRLICRIDDGNAEFITRNHKNWTQSLPTLIEAAKRLPVRQAILDGEVVAMRPDGTTDFQELQNAFRDGRADSLYYYVFDLLYLNGVDLKPAPLEERKRVLAELLAGQAQHLRLSEHIKGNGSDFFKQACKMGLEGIIAKRRDRPYMPGRGYDWLKVKCMQTGEFVIGGYTRPKGSREGFGALLMGYHNAAGELVYAGKVGTGFDTRILRQLLQSLKALSKTNSPFSNLTRAKASWVEPKLVAQVTFGSWTRDGLLRHPSFQGLREDKAAEDVTREKPVSLEEAERKATKKASRRQAPASKGAARTAVTVEQINSDEYDSRKQQLAGVRLTSPDKILYPEQGISKLELANYYRAVADWILPHIVDRPLVFVRCPEGRGKECFYQKHPTMGAPEAFRLVPVRENKKTENYVIVDDMAGLISIAQIGALEVHAWGSRADKLEQPDRLIFDLDPDPTVPWKRVMQSAQQVRKFLEDLGLESFLKTTGGKGLHLVVPIRRRHEWDEVKTFCKNVADAIVAADPHHFTANMAKAARPGKIFLDYLRNGRGATAIAPYSTRSRSGAPISVPIAWKELTAGLTSDHFTIRNIGMRLKLLKKDPWDGFTSVRQGLAGPMKKLRQLAGRSLLQR